MSPRCQVKVLSKAVTYGAPGHYARILVEGRGSVVISDVDAGETLLPIEDPSFANASGGTVVAGPQRIIYTGVDEGGGGAIIGTGVSAPTNALTSAARIGTGLGTGAYKWKTSYQTAAGETLCGPESIALELGSVVTAPSTAPTVTREFGGNLSAGTYRWKVTFVDSAGGETTAGPDSATLTMDDVAAPTTIGTAIASAFSGPNLQDLAAGYSYKYSFVSGSVSTLPSPASNTAITNASRQTSLGKSGVQSPPAGMTLRFYRTAGGGTDFWELPASDTFLGGNASYYVDGQSDNDIEGGNLAPTVSTAIYRKASLTAIPVSSDANVTARKIYRTEANGTVFKLLTTINDNSTTTYEDNTADGSLGATEPGTNTAVYKQASLSNIPVSPDGAVTGRKVYRTEAGGSTFKLLTTIANNTTTTYTDSTADGSLGATEPATDTSGLTAAEGTVNAGSATIPVSSTTPFSSTGGWARIQSQVIRYTGKTSTTLTGVPAAGETGALASSVRYGTEILAAPMLTGVPSAGQSGAVVYALDMGEPVNLLVTRNDTEAQANMAAFVGGDGIHEEYIQDNRLSETEAENRGDARLAEVKDPLVTVRYETFDLTTRAGREVTFSLTEAGISGTFKIQSVVITFPDGAAGVRPLREVEASSRRMSFEALLRLIRDRSDR